MAETFAENRRAKFDYEILESFEAGIELVGHEVKSVRAGKLQLAGAYAILRGGEAWLINATIPPYQEGNVPEDYDPTHIRRLLLRGDEIARLEGLMKQKGVSLVALRAYPKRGLIKLELGLGRSRKKADKREVIKKRDVLREMHRME